MLEEEDGEKWWKKIKYLVLRGWYNCRVRTDFIFLSPFLQKGFVEKQSN